MAYAFWQVRGQVIPECLALVDVAGLSSVGATMFWCGLFSSVRFNEPRAPMPTNARLSFSLGGAAPPRPLFASPQTVKTRRFLAVAAAAPQCPGRARGMEET